MNEDLLRRAAQAVRETTDSVQPRSGLTRARILDGSEKRYGRRRIGLRWFAAFVAALGASTALARVVQYWPEITRALTPQSAEPQQPPAPTRRRAVARPATPAESSPAPQPPAAEPEPVVAEPSIAPPPVAPPRPARAAPRRPAVPEASAPPPAVRAAEAPAAESAELAIFRRAQRLHLARDPQAVAAWDDYLRIAGHGALVPEARYNRALSLVRLGRTDEARAALEPFARGDFGGYRRAEATALLQALTPGDRKP